MVLPPLAYGCSLGRRQLAGHDLAPSGDAHRGSWRSASGWRPRESGKLVMINGHATNGPRVKARCSSCAASSPTSGCASCRCSISRPRSLRVTRRTPPTFTQTRQRPRSCFISNPNVGPDRIVDEPDRTVGMVLQYPVPATTRSGVVGKPTRDGGAGRGAARQPRRGVRRVAEESAAERSPKL